MIQIGKVLGGVGDIPTTYIQLAGAGSINNLLFVLQTFLCMIRVYKIFDISYGWLNEIVAK